MGQVRFGWARSDLVYRNLFKLSKTRNNSRSDRNRYESKAKVLKKVVLPFLIEL